ncbi:MAG TPA: cytochrome c maturation protein CcmE [Nannocystaceae bacterium]|nr:cytochrome c maturation protein CcmE [Nannocystaceae bacterium]
MALTLGTKIVLVAALTGATGYLVFSDTGEGVLEYMYVDKVADDMASYEGRTIKVHGIVVAGSITKKKGTTGDYNFVIEYGGRRLPVHFTNIPPDTFQEEGEVVVTGKLTNGTFESDEMSAKCPSKYEEEASADPDAEGSRSEPTAPAGSAAPKEG